MKEANRGGIGWQCLAMEKTGFLWMKGPAIWWKKMEKERENKKICFILNPSLKIMSK
jgi:hypothetical protein